MYDNQSLQDNKYQRKNKNDSLMYYYHGMVCQSYYVLRLTISFWLEQWLHFREYVNDPDSQYVS